MNVPNIDRLPDAILLKLYMATLQNDEWISSNEIRESFSIEIPHRFIELALSELRRNDLVNYSATGNTQKISLLGVRHIQASLENPETLIAQLSTDGDESVLFLEQAQPTGKEADTQVSDRTEILEDEWEPLPIDRSQPEYEAVDEALDNAIQVVESDNGYAASEPEERDQIVWSLKQGLEAIRERLPSRSQVKSLIVAPLKFLAEKFATTAIGEAAKAALPKIAAWLASMI